MRILIASLLALLSVAARADLYQWTDANGQVHFSDKPEAGQKAKVIKTTTPTTPSTPSAGSTRTSESASDIAERQRQALKRLDDDRKKRADTEAKASAEAEERAAKCKAARSHSTFLGEGGRVFTYDENGGRHYFSEEEIAQKKAAAQEALQDACD